MTRFKVALLANLKANAPTFPGMAEDQWDDLDSEKTVNALLEAIRSGGHTAEFFEGNLNLVTDLPKYKPDICFNISESHFGAAREAHIPALLELLHIPYTGSNVLTLALALDKPMTKRVLTYHDLPTPPFQVFERPDEPLSEDLRYRFPLFAKPSREGTGMGVSQKSTLHDESEMREQVAFLIDKYKQPILVESFIEGREVTVGSVGNLALPAARRIPEDHRVPRISTGLHFLPPLEVDLEPYKESDGVYSNRLKVDLAADLNYLCPATLPYWLVEELNWLTAAVFRVTGAFDVSRVDFRLNENENLKPYILEINPLPGLAPGISDLVIEAAALGIDHAGLVNMILDSALARYGMIPEVNLDPKRYSPAAS